MERMIKTTTDDTDDTDGADKGEKMPAQQSGAGIEWIVCQELIIYRNNVRKRIRPQYEFRIQIYDRQVYASWLFVCSSGFLACLLMAQDALCLFWGVAQSHPRTLLPFENSQARPFLAWPDHFLHRGKR